MDSNNSERENSLRMILGPEALEDEQIKAGVVASIVHDTIGIMASGFGVAKGNLGQFAEALIGDSRLADLPINTTLERIHNLARYTAVHAGMSWLLNKADAFELDKRECVSALISCIIPPCRFTQGVCHAYNISPLDIKDVIVKALEAGLGRKDVPEIHLF